MTSEEIDAVRIAIETECAERRLGYGWRRDLLRAYIDFNVSDGAVTRTWSISDKELHAANAWELFARFVAWLDEAFAESRRREDNDPIARRELDLE